MNYAKVQYDVIKDLEKDKYTRNSYTGTIAEAEEYMWVLPESYYGFAIPKDRYYLSMDIKKDFDINRVINPIKDEGVLLKDTGMTKQAKKDVARIFEFENGDKYYLNEKYLKAYKGFTHIYAKNPVSPGLIYEDGVVIGVICPMRCPE